MTKRYYTNICNKLAITLNIDNFLIQNNKAYEIIFDKNLFLNISRHFNFRKITKFSLAITMQNSSNDKYNFGAVLLSVENYMNVLY